MNMQTTQGLKLKACLNDLSARHQYEQAMLLDVLDTIVQDIHALNRKYAQAIKTNQLRIYVEDVRQVHQKWINMLQELVNAQVTSDTIDYLIEKMQQYAEQLIKMPAATIEPVSATSEKPVTAEENATAMEQPNTETEYSFPVLQKSSSRNTAVASTAAVPFAHAS